MPEAEALLSLVPVRPMLTHLPYCVCLFCFCVGFSLRGRPGNLPQRLRRPFAVNTFIQLDSLDCPWWCPKVGTHARLRVEAGGLIVTGCYRELGVSDPLVKAARSNKKMAPESRLAADEILVANQTVAAETVNAAAPPPVRRGPPLSHKCYPQTTASACSNPVVDDGPHGRRRSAIRPAAHAHER
eukprot:scaffold373_cov66-Phaeocystis_antarctica.AAC.2